MIVSFLFLGTHYPFYCFNSTHSYYLCPKIGGRLVDDSGSFHFEPGRGIIQTNGDLDVVAHEFNHAFVEWAEKNQGSIGYGAVEEGYGIAVAEIASNKDLYLAEKVFGTKLHYRDLEGQPDYPFGLYDMNPSVNPSLKELATRIRSYDKSGYDYKTTDELNAEYKRNWECLDRSSSNYAVIVNPLPTLTCEQRLKLPEGGEIQTFEQVPNPILVSLCNNLKGIDTCGKSIKNYSQYNLAAEDLLVCGAPNVEIKKCESCLAKAYDPNKTPSENYDSCQEQNPATGGGDPPVNPAEIGKDQFGIPICQFEDSTCKQQHCDSLSGARKWICQCYVFNSNGTYFHESIGRNNCQEWCYQDSLNTNNESRCSWDSL